MNKSEYEDQKTLSNANQENLPTLGMDNGILPIVPY